MAKRATLRKLKAEKGIYYDDKEGKFEGDITPSDYRRIRAPFDLVLIFKWEGRRYRKRMRFPRDRTLSRAIRLAQLELERLKIEGPEDYKEIPTLEQLFEEYLELKKEVRAERYAEEHRSVLKNYLFEIRNKKVDQIKTYHLQRGINLALERGRSPRTAHGIQQKTRPLFEYAVKQGYIETNPAKDLEVPKYDNSRNFTITLDKAKALYREIVNYEYEKERNIFIWLLHGRRLNEVLSLEWQDIDFEAGTYTIVSRKNKSRRNATYPLTPMLLDALPKPRRSFGLVFPGSGKDGKIDRVSLRRRHWTRITERAGVEGMHLHDMRHLFGFVAVNALGLPLETVAKVLGHTTTAITKRYANVDQQTAAAATAGFLTLLEGEENE